MNIPKSYDQLDQWTTIMFLYNSALKAINTKIEIMNNEFVHIYHYNPIEHIKSRLKSPDSIVKKLKRHGREVSIANMIEYLSDIAGIRIICSFTSDIYLIADMISRQADITVLNIKDYIKNPKPNGYKSYHMVVTIPIYLSEGPVETKVEIQIRTIAMDFWASLEHKIYYKFEGNAPRSLEVELKVCAEIVDMLDGKMFSLNESIMKISGEQSGAEHRPDKWTGLLTGEADAPGVRLEESAAVPGGSEGCPENGIAAPGGSEGGPGACISEPGMAQEALKEQDPDGV